MTTNWGFLEDEEGALLHERELQTRDEYWGLMAKHGSSILRHGGDIDSAMRIINHLIPHNRTQSLDSYHMEPLERRRGLSDPNIKPEFHGAEVMVDQLLAEYTTVFDGPLAQHRRWTLGSTF